MKNRLLFRAFHPKFGMSEPFDIKLGNSLISFNEINWPIGDEPELTIMQFVGKTDANNKEIYEDDVLQCEHYLGVVKFSTDSSFVIAELDDGRETSFTHFPQQTIYTIIGNIHEGYKEMPLT